MSFGICNLNLVPVRSEPSDKAEMVTQLLFGETIVVDGYYKGWSKIRVVYDNYEGWIDGKQYLPVSDDFFALIEASPQCVTLDLVQLLENISGNYMLPLVLGSTIPKPTNNKFYIENELFTYEGLYYLPEKDSYKKIVENAYMYLHAPYLWGGRSPFGIDCSGFTQMVFKLSGIRLLRNASQQASQGETISFLNEAKPGDLVFFDNEDGQIIHTGILLRNNKVIHASGRVRIDTIDHLGIYDETTQKYTHKLRLIKKMI